MIECRIRNIRLYTPIHLGSITEKLVGELLQIITRP